MRRLIVFALLAAGLLLDPRTVTADDEPPRRPRAGEIDLVLALDTSGSMEGLVNSARDKFWAVIREIARARPEPDLRVGLITYGGVDRDSQRNVLLRTPLTYNFDKVAEEIDETPIVGGVEFVGGAVDMAITRMPWRDGALKIIFVAGNEGVDQDGQVNVFTAAKRAAAAGILVNAVYCGGTDDVIANGWRRLARDGAGTFANIDHEKGTVHVASPYDDKLLRLSTRMNATFRFYGRERADRKAAQHASDERAKAAGAPVAAERAAAKATKQYARVGDLVRASAAKDFDWKALKPEDLPKDLRDLDLDALKKRVAELRAERAKLEKEIKELASKRDAYVAEQRKEAGKGDDAALDRALRDAIRKQMKAAGFKTGK